MTDDELIERLRRTFEDRAGSIHPSPGQVPTTDLGSIASAGPTAIQSGAVSDERRTAEYELSPPTGPVPIVGRIGQAARRGPVLAGIGALAAAAAVVVGVVALSSHGRAVQTGPTHPSTSTNAGTVAPGTSVPPPTSVPTAVTAPPVVAVPAGFRPFSVTFVSPDDGWVLGQVSSKAVLTATTDGGATWAEINTPALPNLDNLPPYNVRFADRNNGWIYTTGPSNQPAELWSTHNGGHTWQLVPVPLTGGTIGDLEAAGGQADMVVYGSCPAGAAGCQGQAEVEILTSPAQLDDWVPSPFQPSIGAGPVFNPALTTWGTHGWLVDNNRTVVSGARLTPTSGWTDWTPPACSKAGGAGLLAASSATDLVAVCAEGMWGTPDPGTTPGHNWLFRSSDGGSSFTSVAPAPGSNPQSLTVAPGSGQTIVVADSQLGLQASFDGGRRWTTVLPGLTNGTATNRGGWYGFVGFTTADQGVAVEYKPSPTLYMTRDGGHTWSPVRF